VLNLQFGLPVSKDPVIVSVWLVLIGIGAVSTLPTFAGKGIKFPVESVVPLLAVIGFLGAAIVTEPWITYLVVSFAYILTLPVSGVKFIRERRLFEAGKL
ncbi:MAG: phosphatidylcholine/phosphatidylserine synthase, partial [Candidatus Puniceispirillum sp.]